MRKLGQLISLSPFRPLGPFRLFCFADNRAKAIQALIQKLIPRQWPLWQCKGIKICSRS